MIDIIVYFIVAPVREAQQIASHISVPSWVFALALLVIANRLCPATRRYLVL